MKTVHLRPQTILLTLALLTSRTAFAVDYPRIILALHPSAYYRLDEPPGATTAHDLAAHTAATVNTPAPTPGATATPPAALPGISTNSAQFTGGAASPSITIPYSAAISPVAADTITAAPFSCECWVRPATAAASAPMSVLSIAGVATGGAYPNGSGWEISETGNPAQWQLTMRASDTICTILATNTIETSQWRHIAVTWDGATATFYINGVAAQSKPVANYLAVPNFAGAIGAGPNTGGANFHGAIAELAFYPYALHPAAISNHCAVGSAIITARAAAATATTP